MFSRNLSSVALSVSNEAKEEGAKTQSQICTEGLL